MVIKLLISLFSQRIKCAFYCMLLLLLLLLPVLAFIKYWARLEQVTAERQLLSFGYLLPGLVLRSQVAPRRGLSLKYAGPLFMLNVCNIFRLTLQLCSLQRRSRRILRRRPVAADAAAAYYGWHTEWGKERERGGGRNGERTRVLDSFSLRTTGVSSLWHLKLPQKE